MNRKIKSLIHLSVITAIAIFLSLQSASAFTAGDVLVKIDIKNSIDELAFPVYAHLRGATGSDYALVVADQDQLDTAGVNYTLLEVIPRKFKGTAYLIALERIKGSRITAANMFNVLLDDGRNIVMRVNESDAEQLNLMGFEIEWLSGTPIVVYVPPQSLMNLATLVDYNTNVADMINGVNQTTIYNYTAGLTGETSVIVGGSSYTITSRHTSSGTPIQKATQYAYEFMQGLGLSASYHDWTYGSYSNRNVIGEKTGTVTPNEIVLITAHFDSMPSGSVSPGADDNSSGSVGVMVAAELFAAQSFERTVRFVLFTGEEQGLYGSNRYADKVVSDGDNIVAVYNMDMIAWDDVGSPDLRLHTRTTASSGYSGDLALANTFVDVVSTYGLSSSLNPIIDSDGITASDHSPFWNKGFSAILAIEDDVNDFCDYYHTTSDQLSTLNMTYYTNYVKASVGTAAHLARVVGGSTLSASFSYTNNLLETTFTDTSTAPDGETIIAWSWNFGDGATSTSQNPVHTYATPGTYTVTLEVTDSASGTDSTSVSVTVTDTLVYCTSAGSNYSYEWTSQVDVGSFSNSSGAAGYSDFTSQVVNAEKGNSQAVALVPDFSGTTYTEYWTIWIDYNKDGDFDDAGETAFTGSGTSTVTGSFTPPMSAVTGYTTMRVSMKYDAYSTPCETFSYGEVEDYTINLTEGVSGPTGSFTVATDGLTADFTDTSTSSGSTIVSWNWNFGDGNTSTQQNPSHTYASAGTYTVTLTVEDNNSASDSTSQSVTVTEVVVQYCASQGNNSSYEWIDLVDIGSFSNSSGAAGYTDFTSMTVDVTAGQNYATTLSPGFSSSTYTEYWKIWIDFNKDGDFTDSGEEVFSGNGSSDVSGNLSIPAGAATGTTRMRVTMKYNGTPTSCETFSYGEVEDYTVNVQ